MSQNYDVLVLGAGTGGYVAAIRAAQLGLKVAIVEKEKVGGTCLHSGCIPSKALLKSADVLHTASRMQEFGVLASAPEFDLGLAMERKDKIVDQLHKGVQHLMKKNGIDVIEGYGRVMGPSIFSPRAGAVRIEKSDGDSTIINPGYVIIATGSRPKALPGLPFDGERVINSNHALQLAQVPKSMIIVGGGAIGCEWASMLSDFGCEVTIVEFMPRILPPEDEEISSELARLFKKRKIKVLTDAKVLPETFSVKDGLATIVIDRAGKQETVSAEKILVSVGREPATDDLGLEATEVKMNRGYIQVDESMRTAEPNLFAIGDAIGGLQLAHVASHEGMIAAETIAGHHPMPINYDHVPRCTYTRPEVASVGITEAEAKARGYEVKTGKFSFRAIGKALVNGEVDGFVKVITDSATNDLLGVHMIGPHVTDLISEAGLAHVLNATAWEIAHSIHPHPTLSEAIGEAALAVDGLAIHF